MNTGMFNLYWIIGKAIMEIKRDDENLNVVVLLSINKNETVGKYTLPKDNKTIFSFEYKLYMPTEQELITDLKNSA